MLYFALCKYSCASLKYHTTVKVTNNFSDDLNLFTSLHGMQTLYSDKNSVRLSVCPSVKRVDCDKTEKSAFRFLYHTKVF